MKNDLLRARRTAKGLSQSDLAEACQISETNIAYYERGQRVPSVFKALRIARVLCCRVDEIFREPK